MSVVVGDQIGSTSVIYSKKDHYLIKGLRFEFGLDFFLEALHYGDFHCGLALIDMGQNVHYINRENRIIIGPDFKFGEDFSEDRAFVSDLERTFLLDTKGKVIKEFDDLLITSPFSNGLARVSKLSDGGNLLTDGFVDLYGEFIIPKIFESVIKDATDLVDENNYYSDGLIRVKQNGLYGFVDKELNIVIPFEYEHASRFESGTASVYKNNKAGFINKYNEPLFKSGFTRSMNFREGLAPVTILDQWGLINTNGEFVIEPKYSGLARPQEGEVIFVENNKLGIMKLDEEVIIPPIYDEISYAVEGIHKFLINNRPGVMDRYGNSIIADVDIDRQYKSIKSNFNFNTPLN